jgi:hypothetical protein
MLVALLQGVDLQLVRYDTVLTSINKRKEQEKAGKLTDLRMALV